MWQEPGRTKRLGVQSEVQGTCINTPIGGVGPLKSTSLIYVMNSSFWKLPRQIFLLYQPQVVPCIKQDLASAKMG
jgi:hypothetical protein